VRKLVMPVLCIALVAAACSGPGDDVVATVGGEVITVDDVSGLFDTETIPIDTGFRDAAFRLVALTVLVDAYEAEFDARIDEAAVDEMHREFMASLEADGVTVAQVTGIPDATEEMIRFNAILTVLRDDVIAGLISRPEFVADLLADPAGITTVCVRHILTETEPEILDVQARLEGGEDFATVADEVSLDTATPGGDLGCATADRYVGSFAVASVEAELGALHGPIPTEYGFHLMIVDERTTPTAEEVTGNPASFASEQTIESLWSDWFNGKLREADIDVNPRFGVWDADTLRIVASATE